MPLSIQEANTDTAPRQFERGPLPVDVNCAIAHVPLTTPRQYTRQLIRVIAESHGVTIDEIFGRNRTAKVIAAKREAIVAVIQSRPYLSYPDIGRIFGLDHTTCVHHAQRAGLPSRKAVNHD